MSNNVPVTAGSGTNVGTDDCAGVHIQLVKLVDGTEDSTTRIPGDGTKGIRVDLTNTGTNTNTILVTTGGGVDSSGGQMTDTTAHAWRTMMVDSTGTTVSTTVAATTDTITAKLGTDTLQNGTTALTPKFAAIAASGSGATTIVAAVSSKKLRIVSYVLSFNAAVNAKWVSHTTTGTATGLIYGGTNSQVPSGFCPVGFFETVAGEALDLNLSGNVAVGGHLTYVEV